MRTASEGGAAAGRRVAFAAPEAVAAAVALVPGDWLADPGPHAEYLTRRLAVPRPFVEEAERARRGA